MFQKRAAGDRYAGSNQSAAPTEPADESEQDLDIPVFLRRLAAAPQPPQSPAMALDLTREGREGRMALDLSVEA